MLLLPVPFGPMIMVEMMTRTKFDMIVGKKVVQFDAND